MPHQAWLDPARPELLCRLESITDRLDVAALFAAPQPLEVELGSGDGSFLARYAKLHPEHNFIGLERLLGRARKLERKGLRAGLQNLRVVRLEATYFTEYLLPLASVEAFHVYFPDPWPKKRHHQNRLINERFNGVLAKVLKPGGYVHLRTDDADYHEWMLAAFAATPAFRPVEPPADLCALTTDFEREFNEKGIPTLRASYQLT
jgi:tRNA (guanine-N7-)-methyltransferase